MTEAEAAELLNEAFILYFVILPTGAAIFLLAQLISDWRQRRRIARILGERHDENVR